MFNISRPLTNVWICIQVSTSTKRDPSSFFNATYVVTWKTCEKETKRNKNKTIHCWYGKQSTIIDDQIHSIRYCPITSPLPRKFALCYKKKKKKGNSKKKLLEASLFFVSPNLIQYLLREKQTRIKQFSLRSWSWAQTQRLHFFFKALRCLWFCLNK